MSFTFKIPQLKNTELLPAAQAIRAAYNVGLLLDIPTGFYTRGEFGQSILHGGFANLNSVVGPGNSFKSGILLSAELTIMSRFPSARLYKYDTENTVTYARMAKYARAFPELQDLDWEIESNDENGRFRLIQGCDQEGDVFFEAVKAIGIERQKLKMKGKGLMTTPILDAFGKHVKLLWPTIFSIDSLSMFATAAVMDKIYDKNNIGESGNNMAFMREAAAKTQMFMQLPNVTAASDLILNMSAHVGGTIQLDPYAARPQELTFSKPGTKVKNVPEKFKTINNLVLEIYGAAKLTVSSKDKSPKYPLHAEDKQENNDLMRVHGFSTRNKAGPSGVAFGWIASQSAGVLSTESEFYYLKEMNDNWGFSGNDQWYSLDLYPGVKLSRTTLRTRIAEDHKLVNALLYTSQMLQIYSHWKDYDIELICTPEQLRNDITERGYDWDQLLEVARPWWVHLEEEMHVDGLELSTEDLLRMRIGDYHPYWLESDKKTIKKLWQKKLDNLAKEKEIKLEKDRKLAMKRAAVLNTV